MSWCDCDLEMPTLYRENKVKARKAHECSDCCGEIKPREVYTSIIGLWGGKFSIYKRCQDCTVIRCDLGELHDGCECIGMGDLREYLMKTRDEDSEPIIAAFNAAAKERNGKPILK